MNLQAARQTLRSALPLIMVVAVLGFTAYRLRFAPVQVRAVRMSSEVVTPTCPLFLGKPKFGC